MKLTIRIYKRHDLDLLYLRRQESDLDFASAMKEALKSYVAGKPKKNKLPSGPCQSVQSMPTSSQLHLDLDDIEDAELIAWIRSITRGRRNNICKNIFRSTFPPFDLPYKSTSESQSF